MAEIAYKPAIDSVFKQEAIPPLVQTIPVYIPTEYDPIFSYTELDTAGDADVYIINNGKVLMVTAINLTATVAGPITENAETFLYAVKGDSINITSRILAFVPEGGSAIGDTHIVNLTFPTPIKLDKDVWNKIMVRMSDSDCHIRVQVYGYEIDKKVIPLSK